MEVIDSIVNQGHGYLAPRYLVIHETANPGATALNHVSYWRNNPDVPMTHYVCDWTGKVYRTVPDDRICWHVGNANAFTVGIELCNTAKGPQFERVWETAVQFAEWYLRKRGWGIDRLVSHAYCSATWGGSDHTDPLGWFSQHGRTFEEFKSAVNGRLEDDMPTPKEIWEYKINGVSAGDRLYLDNKQLFDRTDFSGRGKEATVIERAAWMAAKQEKMQAQLDRLEKKIDELIKAVG